MELTSRVGFGLFGTGLAGDVVPDEAADISKINDNFRLLDKVIGWIFVTSTTHPANPFRGLGIFETDTGRAYMHDGSTFIFAFDTNLANGLRGTTAQRDAYWGKPTTGATTPEITARVALANKGPRWFNTEKGYEEQYFAKVGDTGVLAGAQALVPDWYPSGAGIVPEAFVSFKPGANVAIGAGNTVITTNSTFMQEMSAPVGGVTYGKLDGTSPGLRLTPGIDGIWEVTCHSILTVGNWSLVVKRNSVTADYAGLVAVDSAGPGSASVSGASITKPVRMAPTDFLIFGVFSPSAGAFSNGFEENTVFGMRWLGVRTR